MSEESSKQVQLTAGEQLRHTREQKNLSLADVASQLNLEARIIEAIEANDFESLPAATYARGYLRSYAKILNMDAEVILAAYNNEAPDPPEIIPEVKHSSQTSSSDKPVKAFTYLVSLTLVILLAAWLYSNYLIDPAGKQVQGNVEENNEVVVSALSYEVPIVQHSDQPFYRVVEIDEAESIENVTTSTETIINEEANDETSNSETVPDDEDYPRTLSSELDGPDSLVLRLSADSWIEIFDALGNNVFLNLGREGQQLNLRGTAPCSVVLGFAEGVSVEINGSAFDTAPFTEGSIARFTLDR